MQDWFVGNSARIAHTITRAEDDADFVVSSVVAYVYDAEGAAVVNGLDGSVDNASSAASHEIYYLWTPATTGRFTFELFYTIGAQTLSVIGELVVLPKQSAAYPYAWRVRDLLHTHAEGEFVQTVAMQDLLNGLAVAVRAYSKDNPAHVWADTALTTAVEYDLPTGWEAGFSRFLRLIYRPDATSRTDLKSYEYEWDDDLGVFRLLSLSPSSGQTLSQRFRTRHTLSHALDTVKGSAETPQDGADFEAVCMYAAGVLLAGELANQAAQTEAPEVAAQIVSYRDQQQRRRQQGMDLMARAKELWARAAEASVFASQRAAGPSFAFGVASGRRGR